MRVGDGGGVKYSVYLNRLVFLVLAHMSEGTFSDVAGNTLLHKNCPC